MSRSPHRDRRGSAAVELALLAPVLALVAVMALDIVTVLRVGLRLERVAGEVANVAAQYETLRPADVSALFGIAQRVADWVPVTGERGRVILSGLANTGSGTVVLWQQPTGGLEAASVLGAESAVVTNPGLQLAPNQGAVAVEVFVAQDTWVLASAWLGAGPFSRLQAFAAQRPRIVSVLRMASE